MSGASASWVGTSIIRIDFLMPSKLIKRISPRSGLLVLQRVVDKNFALGRSTNDDRNKANLEYGWFWFKEPFGRIFRHDQGAHKAPWREFNTELILRSRSLSSLQFGPDSDFHHRSGDHRHPLAPAPRRDRKCPRPVDGTASMPSGRLLGSQKDRSESSLFNCATNRSAFFLSLVPKPRRMRVRVDLQLNALFESRFELVS